MSAHQTHVANGVGHFDVAGPDLASLGRFYAGVFGWKISSKGPGYALVETPVGAVNGAIVESQTAALTLGVVVPDLDKAVADAAWAGGGVLMPVTDNGWVKKAQVTDPAGNVITLIQG
jgi:predicted enzyme related to lactoylglutathione lyase